MWMYTFLTFLCGVVTGGCLVGTGLWYVLSFFFHDPDEKKRVQAGVPGQPLPKQPTSATFQLPPVLLSKISDESCKAKESCWAVNFILYFMFRELKNSEGVRRWVLRKLSLEFDELLASSVLGKFFSNITIQNIDIGQNFPIVNWLRTVKVELHPVFKSISTLDILVDLDYSGGFQFSIQAESHLKHSAFLSVQFNEVKGQARLQFCSEPYAHWSFSFAENPEIDISVVSQLYGKSFNQVTAIIASQLKRSVKKKHTLPMYKIRYKPFFNRIQPLVAACCPGAAPRIETTGTLTITLVECRGLMQNLLRGNVFTTLGIADFDWIAAYSSAPKYMYVVRDVGYVKTAKRESKLDFRLIQHGDVPVVESVETSMSVPHAIRNVMNMVSFSPTECELEPGDEIIAVDGKRVSTIKQCVKYFCSSTSVRVIWRIRRNCVTGEACEDGGVGVGGEIATESEEVPESPPEPTPAINIQTTGSQSQGSSRRNSFTGEIMSEGFPLRTQPSKTQRIGQVFKTNPLPACRDPIYQESFLFTLEESHQFLNITCWSSADQSNSSETSATSSPTTTPVKRSKVSPPTSYTLPFGRDSVVGSICIPLVDIVTECSTTGMGFFVKDFYFGPPDGTASEARENALKEHSGFEPTMCYGKVTLSFLFKSDDPSTKRRQSVEAPPHSSTLHLDLGSDETQGFTEHAQPSPSDGPKSHRFVKTHFRSSATCDYCNKKIWLKEAYVCECCGMKCHKKCNERCVANTICKGEMYQQGRSTNPPPPTGNPEIITTESEPQEISTRGNQNGSQIPDAEVETLLQPAGTQNNVRRRTLSGLIVNAVQSRSVQLKRVGSATTLLPPTITVNSTPGGSKSLPPSPETSPGTSRKTSDAIKAEDSANIPTSKNPFETLDPTGSGQLSQQELDLTVEQLVLQQAEYLVSLAKDTGRDLYADQALPERKEKLNSMLTRLQVEIDGVTQEQRSWTKEDSSVSKDQKQLRCEKKVQALALLMLHYCAGLQNVQDLEEGMKEETESAEDLSKISSLQNLDTSETELTAEDLNPATFHI